MNDFKKIRFVQRKRSERRRRKGGKGHHAGAAYVDLAVALECSGIGRQETWVANVSDLLWKERCICLEVMGSHYGDFEKNYKNKNKMENNKEIKKKKKNKKNKKDLKTDV